MYKLKKQYEGHTISKGGYSIILDNVKQNQIKSLGLESYFLKTSKNDKTKKTK